MLEENNLTQMKDRVEELKKVDTENRDRDAQLEANQA